MTNEPFGSIISQNRHPIAGDKSGIAALFSPKIESTKSISAGQMILDFAKSVRRKFNFPIIHAIRGQQIPRA